jgi:hypothetical protein
MDARNVPAVSANFPPRKIHLKLSSAKRSVLNFANATAMPTAVPPAAFQFRPDAALGSGPRYSPSTTGLRSRPGAVGGMIGSFTVTLFAAA